MQKGRIIFCLLTGILSSQVSVNARSAFGGGAHPAGVSAAQVSAVKSTAVSATAGTMIDESDTMSASSSQKTKATTSIVITEEVKDPNAKPIPTQLYSLGNTLFNATDRPDWMTRTDLTYSIASYNKPVTALETLQPIFQDNSHTWFWRGRYSYMEIIPTLNFGAGYRYLPDNRAWMLGVNLFYDMTTRYTYKRESLGGELYTKYLTFRANYYNRMSGHRIIGINHFAQALSGYDYSVETPVPYLPWVRFTLEGYHWTGKNTASENGSLASFRVYPARQVELTVGYARDVYEKNQGFLQIAYYFSSPAFVEYSASTLRSSSPWMPRNLDNMRLEKVRRQDQFTVETSRGLAPVSGTIVTRGIS